MKKTEEDRRMKEGGGTRKKKGRNEGEEGVKNG